MEIKNKLRIVIEKDGTIRAWSTPELEQLLAEVDAEPIEEREGGPRPVGDFPFHPEFCG